MAGIKVLVTINHPAHVHFFKHFIWEMEKRGHEIRVAAMRKDVALNLLQSYDIDYTLLPIRQKNGFDVITEQLKYDYHLYTIVQEFKPDIVTPARPQGALSRSARRPEDGHLPQPAPDTRRRRSRDLRAHEHARLQAGIPGARAGRLDLEE